MLLAVAVPPLATVNFLLWDEHLRLVARSAALDDQITHLQTYIDQVPPEQTAIRQAKSALAQRRLLTTGNSTAVAGAELQRELGQLVQQAGGRLLQAELLNGVQIYAVKVKNENESSMPSLERLALRVNLHGEIVSLAALLTRISHELPRVLVKKFSVGVSQDARLHHNLEQTRDVQLVIKAELVAFRTYAY